MSNDNGVISAKQSMIMVILLFCAPAIRYIPIYTAINAKRAAWISPLVALVFELIYLFVWVSLLKKYAKRSYTDIIKDAVGKVLGNIIIILYFIWITFLLSYNVRMYTERILAIAMPNVSQFLVLGVMMLLIWYVTKNGIIPISKMSEVFFALLGLIFVVYNVLVIPNINFKELVPITYNDTIPIFKASFGVLAIFSYNILLFFINDKVDYKDKFKKVGIKALVIITLISLSVIIVPLGVFGWSLLTKMPIPYLNSMTEIALFDVIERTESGIIMFWIIADFMLITIFVYTAIHILRLSFNVSNVKPLTVIYIIGIFFLTLVLAKSTLELKILSERIITPFNVIMGYILPILVFVIAKLRKKV